MGEAVPPEMLCTLGRTRVDYVFAVESTTVTSCLSVICVAGPGVMRPCFHDGPQLEAAACLAVLRYSTALRGLLVHLAEQSAFPPKQAVGLSADFIVRKLCLSHWGGIMQWREVP